MELLYIIFICVGLILGYAIAHFKNQSEINRLEERQRNQAELAEKAAVAQKEAQEQARLAENAKIELTAVNRNLKEKLDSQREEMVELQKRFKDEFENLANKIFEEKSQKFTEQNKEKIDELLRPLNKKMSEFREQVEKSHKEDLEGRSALKEKLEQLHQLNNQLSEDSQNLTKALKGDSKTQGNWGEVILQRILERSGLTKDREYEIQSHHVTEDGRRLQPDVVVNLPDGKRIIIDSKVSLKDYENYFSEQDETQRLNALKRHVNSCRNHVKGLSKKKYQQLYDGNSPNFVLMFIPIESAFAAALQFDNNLFNEAFEQNIVIVSPSTLLATLATIDNVWKQEYQNKNAQKIARRGASLYKKIRLFVESLEDVGKRIRQTQDSYDEAMNRLSTGKGNVIRQADMLRKMGIQNGKALPGDLTNKALPDEEE